MCDYYEDDDDLNPVHEDKFNNKTTKLQQGMSVDDDNDEIP